MSPTLARPSGITRKVMTYQLRDLSRSGWLFAYSGFFLLVTDALLRFGDGARAVVSLLNVVLLVVPLVAAVFGTTFVYNAREFTELLLAQPVSRRAVYFGHYLGLTLPLASALAIGIGVPFAIHGARDIAGGAVATLLLAGIALTSVFSAIAFTIAIGSDDRLRGLGIAVATWLVLALLYDGLVMLAASLLANYPLERGLLAVMIANPVDLARIALLLRLDLAALMGYTGAVFKQFFGSATGVAVAGVALAGWIALPLLLGLRRFERKDF